jgi:Flp pilus assembly protein CpaB
LKPGFVAVTVPIEAPRLVGGAVAKDDHVTVYATVGDATLTLIPSAHVLQVTGVGTTSSGASSAGGAVTITFELKPADSQRLVLAQEQGSLWIALLPPGDNGTRQAPLTLNGLNR